LLILHSPRDAVVAIDNATHIFLAARHPKSFVSLDPADHLLTREDDALYVAAVISAWASRYVTAPVPLRKESQRGETVVEETGEGAFQVEIMAGGARIIADEPPEVGGLGSGPTPYDLVSAGLGACTAMTLRMYARRKELPLDSVRVTVAHARDPAQKPPDQFSRAISLSGPLTDDQRARLLEIADRCPVHRTLSGGARFVTEFGEDPVAAESPIQHAVDVDRLALES
jgi:putative redox protein